MKEEVAHVLSEFQTEIVGTIGFVIHALIRRDVPWFHHVLMLFIGLPVTIYIIVPGVSAWVGLSPPTEKALTFVLALWGRDALIGLSKLGRQFANDPISFVRKK